jgi:O-antigen ligase
VVLGIAGISVGASGTGENYIGGVHIMRFTGTHENPNKAAAYMCSALPFGLFAIRHSASRLVRLGFALATVALIVAIFATFSRSVIVAIAVVIVGVCAHEMRSRRSFVALGFALTVGILFMPRYYWDRVMTLPDALRDSTQDWSVYLRMLAMRTAWEMFLDNPILGVGIGNFIVSSGYRLFVRIVVHNTYLEVLVGVGVLGLCAFVGMVAAGMRQAVAGARHRWKLQPPWMRSLSYYTILSALSIGISAFFSSMPFRYPLWIPVAMGLVIGNMLRAEKSAQA